MYWFNLIIKKMKNKVLNFVLKAYPNVWFNLGAVVLAAVGGLTRTFLAIVVPMVYLLGAATYDQNKPKLVPAKPVAKAKVTKTK